MSGYPTYLLVSWMIVAAILAVQLRNWRRSRDANPHGLPLPPGPPLLPLIGNLRDIPLKTPWEAYNTMSKTYGDIMYLTSPGLSVVILNSAEACADLMDKRSTNYSSRFPLTMLNDLMGYHWAISLMPYNERWRRHRRTFHQYFGTRAAESFKGVQTAQSQELLRRLKSTPEHFVKHIRQATSATIMKVTYGFDVKDEHDEWVELVEHALVGYSIGGILGKWLVDFIPILQHIPAWFPGANFQKVATHYRRLSMQMSVEPFEAVKNGIMTGTAGPSVSASMIENLPDGPARQEVEETCRNSAAIAYGAGADTTTSALLTFVLAMVLYPEVQKKAQAEMDAIVGPNRLPSFDDRDSLPYIEAIVREILRWQLVTPLAAPHYSSDDDEYRGYHIPKGSMIIGNAWAILHNPEEYPNPEAFIPERFLKDGQINPDVRDPSSAAFGFGRRICPGTAMTLNSIYSIVTSVLHTFNITRAIDAKGEPIPVDFRMTEGVISFPTSFTCQFKPRSAAAEALIMNDY